VEEYSTKEKAKVHALVIYSLCVDTEVEKYPDLSRYIPLWISIEKCKVISK
jgi:hypothetical protein